MIKQLTDLPEVFSVSEPQSIPGVLVHGSFVWSNTLKRSREVSDPDSP